MERWKESQLNQLSRTTEIDIAYRISLGFAKNIGFKFFAFSTTYPTKADHFNTVQLNTTLRTGTLNMNKKISMQ